MKTWPVLLLGLSMTAQAADPSESVDMAAEEAITSHEVFESERTPTVVYVETEHGTYRSTRSDEHCYFHEAHDHIHCTEEVPATKTVIIEEDTVYRTTRSHRRYQRDYDPLLTGLGVGLAIGLPILVYDNHRHYRRDHHWDRHSRHRSHRHDRSKRFHYGYGDSRRKHHRGFRY